MPRLPDHLTNVLDITASSSENGDVRVNLGNSATGTGAAADAPWWANGCAFVARPDDPDDAGACEALYLQNGNQKIAVAARDARYYQNAGALQPGDAAILGPGEARLLRKAANDSLTLYSANQKDDGSSMLLSIIGEDGVILVANGGTYIEMKKDSLTLSAGGSMLVLDSTGVAVFGSHFGANTSTGNLGTVAAGPPPPVMSIIGGVSGIAGAPSPFWTVALSV